MQSQTQLINQATNIPELLTQKFVEIGQGVDKQKTDKQTNKQTDTHPNRQTHKHTNRQTEGDK